MSDIPGIQNVGPPLAQCPHTLLDAVANISQHERGDVSSTMASLKDSEGTLETRLYIVLNHEDDGAARRCCQHLEALFSMLRQVPYKPPAIDGSKVITGDLKNKLIEFSCAIHNYSFNIFAYRVAKCKDKLSEIRGYIEQDETYFTDDQRSTLLRFLRYVASIIEFVAKEETTKQLPNDLMRLLLDTYSYWMGHNLLPEDLESHNMSTLLNLADIWLAKGA